MTLPGGLLRLATTESVSESGCARITTTGPITRESQYFTADCLHAREVPVLAHRPLAYCKHARGLLEFIRIPSSSIDSNLEARIPPLPTQ
jgi:hypothetical protein